MSTLLYYSSRSRSSYQQSRMPSDACALVRNRRHDRRLPLLRIALVSTTCMLIDKASCLSSRNHPAPKRKQVLSKKADGSFRKFTFDGGDGDRSDSRYWYPANIKQALKVRRLENKIQSALSSTFLPAGYPKRTPPGYLTYSMWSWVQDLSTQMRGVLATQRVLEGVGVGKEGATALSASLNFIVRDGCGMLATLLFTSVAASKFRADIKRWRLFADLIVDVGITLEVAATLFPKAWFLPLICVGNMCKAICGVAAGSCGGAINLHWAKGSDISDINAKFGAQHTVTGGLGLLFAALFTTSISSASSSVMWILYAALTGIHIYANTECMKLVAFDSLNTPRMMLLASQFFSQRECDTSTCTADTMNVMMDPETMSKNKEPLFFAWRRPRNLTYFPVLVGISFNDFAKLSGESVSSLQETVTKAAKKHYLVSVGRRKRGRGLSVLLSFFASATPEERTKGYFHALLLCKSLEKQGFRPRKGISHFRSYEKIKMAEEGATNAVEKSWPKFREEAAKAGWKLYLSDFSTKGYELEIK
mmetsp:Transcript_24795/g.53670  ORF Transcript_24795/g.53670 Transcript_24795/m.53670 type:complete len:534 (+) Transcript_24795:65-1666(+)